MSLVTLLPVAFVAGLFGSAHCLGMCGAIVVLFEGPKPNGHRLNNTVRRGLYNGGRLCFYALLGAVAGASGTVLTTVLGLEPGLKVLRLTSALLVVGLGVTLLLRLPLLAFLERGGASLWRRLSPLARHVLPISSPAKAIAAGFLWGALPCGLVYSAVAIAAASGSAAAGVLVMAGFWLGTLPALLLAGTSAQYFKQHMMQGPTRRLAGAALIGVGVFALAMPLMHGDSRSEAQHDHVAEISTR